MSILQRRQSAVVYVVGLLSGLALAALLGVRPWETRATAQAQDDSALAAKVANLQTNVQNLRSRIDNSKERIVSLEELLEDVLLGDVHVGNADKLDGLDSTAFQRVLSAGDGIRIEDQEISVDFTLFDQKYLSKQGGTVGPLTVEGDLTVDGKLILGSFSGYPEAPKAGTVIFNTESRRAELYDGTNWRPL
jgi:hypothetical protein